MKTVLLLLLSAREFLKLGVGELYWCLFIFCVQNMEGFSCLMNLDLANEINNKLVQGSYMSLNHFDCPLKTICLNIPRGSHVRLRFASLLHFSHLEIIY